MREGSNQPGTQEEVGFLSCIPLQKGNPVPLGNLPRSFGLKRLENILREEASVIWWLSGVV